MKLKTRKGHGYLRVKVDGHTTNLKRGTVYQVSEKITTPTKEGGGVPLIQKQFLQRLTAIHGELQPVKQPKKKSKAKSKK